MSAPPGADPRTDRCGATCCRYPNGPFQILLSQMLLFCGAALSAAAVTDCHFVEADVVGSILPESLLQEEMPDDKIQEYFPGDYDGRRGFGFAFWELPDGECSWRLEEFFTKEVWKAYKRLLGGAWEAPRGLAIAVTAMAWLFWVYLLSYACVAHVKGLRFVGAFYASIILVTLQSVIFVVMRSGFCEERYCEMGRSGWFNIGAIICFFLTGVLMAVSSDHPGASAAPAAAEGKIVSEEDEEAPKEEGEAPEEEAPNKEEEPADDAPQDEGGEGEKDPGLDESVEVDAEDETAAVGESATGGGGETAEGAGETTEAAKVY